MCLLCGTGEDAGEGHGLPEAVGGGQGHRVFDLLGVPGGQSGGFQEGAGQRSGRAVIFPRQPVGGQIFVNGGGQQGQDALLAPRLHRKGLHLGAGGQLPVEGLSGGEVPVHLAAAALAHQADRGGELLRLPLGGEGLAGGEGVGLILVDGGVGDGEDHPLCELRWELEAVGDVDGVEVALQGHPRHIVGESLPQGGADGLQGPVLRKVDGQRRRAAGRRGGGGVAAGEAVDDLPVLHGGWGLRLGPGLGGGAVRPLADHLAGEVELPGAALHMEGDGGLPGADGSDGTVPVVHSGHGGIGGRKFSGIAPLDAHGGQPGGFPGMGEVGIDRTGRHGDGVPGQVLLQPGQNLPGGEGILLSQVIGQLPGQELYHSGLLFRRQRLQRRPGELGGVQGVELPDHSGEALGVGPVQPLRGGEDVLEGHGGEIAALVGDKPLDSGEDVLPQINARRPLAAGGLQGVPVEVPQQGLPGDNGPALAAVVQDGDGVIIFLGVHIVPGTEGGEDIVLTVPDEEPVVALIIQRCGQVALVQHRRSGIDMAVIAVLCRVVGGREEDLDGLLPGVDAAAPLGGNGV